MIIRLEIHSEIHHKHYPLLAMYLPELVLRSFSFVCSSSFALLRTFIYSDTLILGSLTQTDRIPLSHTTVHISLRTFDMIMEVIPKQLNLRDCFKSPIRSIKMSRKQN